MSIAGKIALMAMKHGHILVVVIIIMCPDHKLAQSITHSVCYLFRLGSIFFLAGNAVKMLQKTDMVLK